MKCLYIFLLGTWVSRLRWASSARIWRPLLKRVNTISSPQVSQFSVDPHVTEKLTGWIWILWEVAIRQTQLIAIFVQILTLSHARQQCASLEQTSQIVCVADTGSYQGLHLWTEVLNLLWMRLMIEYTFEYSSLLDVTAVSARNWLLTVIVWLTAVCLNWLLTVIVWLKQIKKIKGRTVTVSFTVILTVTIRVSNTDSNNNSNRNTDSNSNYSNSHNTHYHSHPQSHLHTHTHILLFLLLWKENRLKIKRTLNQFSNSKMCSILFHSLCLILCFCRD